MLINLYAKLFNKQYCKDVTTLKNKQISVIIRQFK